MVAHKKRPVNRVRQSTTSKSKKKKTSKKKKSNIRISTSKKKKTRRSNTRISKKKKKRSEAAEKGWKTRRLNKRVGAIKKLNKKLKKNKSITQLKAENKKLKVRLAIAEKKERKLVEQVIKENIEEQKKIAQVIYDSAISQGLVESEDFKLSTAISEAYWISQTNPDKLDQAIEDIAEDFDISESEAWFLFRENYEEAAG